MLRSLPQRLPLAPQYPAEWRAGRALSGLDSAPQHGFRMPLAASRSDRLGASAWRVIPGSMGLPSLIVPVVGEIIP